MQHLVTIVEKTSTGFSAYCPDLPGCVATGATKEETEENMAEAIRLHIAGQEEDGTSVFTSTPAPRP